MAELPVETFDLKPFELETIRDVLNENLKKYYADVNVTITECPDLTQEPYNLPVEGFGGGSRDIVDLGGVPYLLPTVDRTRQYDLREIATKYIGSERYPDGWYMNGAGAGPWPSIGKNCELVLSLNIGSDGEVAGNSSKVAITSEGNEKDVTLKDLEEPKCAVLGNFMVSTPVRGKVLEIKCGRRTDPDTNFTLSIREALDKAFPNDPVGLGGLFLVRNAPTHTHIMRDFSETPLHSDAEVDEWLKFFDMDPPMLFQSVLFSSDPGLDLRIDHSHGWSLNPERKEGGHYHHDLEADNVEYIGHYVVAQKIIRIDRPNSAS